MDDEKLAVETKDEEVAAPVDESQDDTEFTGANETEPAEPSTAEASGQDAHTEPIPGPSAEQAEKRRRREAKEREQRERLKDDAFKEAIVAATGGINPFTGEKIEDAVDVREFLAMKEIEKNGGDPVADYRKTIKERERQRTSADQAREKQQNDLQAFTAAHPDVDVDKLMTDSKFSRFAGKRVSSEGLEAVYKDYLSFMSEIDARADVKAKNVLAKAKASPGSLTGEQPAPEPTFEEMSEKEFEQYVAKAKRGDLIKS